MDLSITIGGVSLTGGLSTVFSDGTDTLKESVTFLSATRSPTDPDADWETYYVVILGVREKSVGNWDVFLYPIYGSTADPGKNPYYTRLTITAEFSSDAGATSVDIDLAGSASIIGHGQGIPPTVVLWDDDAEEVISSVEGHTLAFTENLRIKQNPNDTGFGQDGEFVIRYDHAINVEGRSIFYPAGSWPFQFVHPDGTFRRGDLRDLGQIFGYTMEERGPYVEFDDRDATNYPIAHLAFNGRDILDADEWDNNWENIGYSERADSGIGPLCGNLVSRGASELRDFGYAWLVKSLAARVLTQFPDPTNPHSRNEFTYNYGSDAMRGKGRTVWVMVVLFRALTLLTTVRNTAGSIEVDALKDELAVRVTKVLNIHKQDYANNDYLQFKGGGRFIRYWELGHYWQGLLMYQEAVQELLGLFDTEVHSMMVQFAKDVHEETLLWVNNGPHPRDAAVTYTGGFNGWNLEFEKDLVVPSSSTPTEGIGPTMVAVYEWAKVNGIDNGAKQDAIIAQYSGTDYKWHYAGAAAPILFAAVSLAGVGTLALAAPIFNHNNAVALAGSGGLVAAPTIAGGTLIRLGTPIPWTAVSVGTPILLGPGVSDLGDKQFEIVRGDDYKQPFTVTLDQSRTLNGSESWKFSVRRTKNDSDPVLIALSSPAANGIEIDGSFQPTVVFTPADFALIKKGSDLDYVYDLEMTKAGKFETYSVDILTIIGDVTR